MARLYRNDMRLLNGPMVLRVLNLLAMALEKSNSHENVSII